MIGDALVVLVLLIAFGFQNQLKPKFEPVVRKNRNSLRETEYLQRRNRR